MVGKTQRELKLERQQDAKARDRQFKLDKARRKGKDELLVKYSVRLKYIVNRKERWTTKNVAEKLLVPKTIVKQGKAKMDDWVKDKANDNIDENPSWIIAEEMDYATNGGITYNTVKGKGISRMPMYGTKLMYSLLGDTTEMNPTDTKCVEDYIYYHIREVQESKGRFKKVTRKTINDIIGDNPTTEDVIDLAKVLGNMSIYAFDPMGNLVDKFVSEESTTFCYLVYIINNNHCYPVLDKDLKIKAIKKNSVELSKCDVDISYDSYDIIYDADYDPLKTDYNNQVILIEFVEPGSDDLKYLALATTKATGMIVYQFQLSRSNLVCFIHPVSGHIICSAPEHDKRRDICETIYKDIVFSDEFVWANQSWAYMAKNLFEQKFLVIPRSNLSEYVYEAFEINPVAPIIDCFSDSAVPPSYAKTYDIIKSYSKSMRDNKYKYAIFSIYDEIKDYNGEEIICGEYEIGNITVGQIPIKGGFKPYNLILELLERNIITKKSIMRFVTASFQLDESTFKEYVELCYDKFGKNGKHMVNHLNGVLGKKCSRHDKGCITDSTEMANAIMITECEKQNRVEYDTVGDLIFVRSTKTIPVMKTSYPMYRHTIANGIINLLELQDIVAPSTSKAKILNINTDCITVVHQPKNIKVTEDETALGQIRIEQEPKHGRYMKIKDYDEVPEYKPTEWTRSTYKYTDTGHEGLPDSFLGYGLFGGECKSRTLQNLFKYIVELGFQVLVLTFQNAPRKSLKQRGVEVKTFDSYFTDGIPNGTKSYDYIIIDEWDATPVKWKTQMYVVKCMFNHINFIGVGCPNQCPSVEIGTKSVKSVDYQVTRDMFGNNLIEFEYCPEYGRFDPPLYKIAKSFLKTKLLKQKQFNPINEALKINICRLNNTRLNINYTKSQEQPKGTLIGDINYNIGMPVIANVNTRMYDELEIVNTQFFTIKDYNKESIFLADNGGEGIVEVHKDRFRSLKDGKDNGKDFELAYAFTVCKTQSITINEPYNIYDASTMSYEEMNTAMTRGTKLSDIHCEPKTTYYKNHYYDTNCMLVEGIIKEGGIKYQQGKIYEITYKDEIVYVGSTTKGKLEYRLQGHKNDSKHGETEWLMWVRDLGFHKRRDLKINLIEAYPCRNNTELTTREKHWITKRIDDGCILKNSIMRKKPKQKNSVFNIDIKLFKEITNIPKITNDEKEFKLIATHPITKKKITKGYKKKGYDEVHKELTTLLISILSSNQSLN